MQALARIGAPRLPGNAAAIGLAAQADRRARWANRVCASIGYPAFDDEPGNCASLGLIVDKSGRSPASRSKVAREVLRKNFRLLIPTRSRLPPAGARVRFVHQALAKSRALLCPLRRASPEVGIGPVAMLCPTSRSGGTGRRTRERTLKTFARLVIELGSRADLRGVVRRSVLACLGLCALSGVGQALAVDQNPAPGTALSTYRSPDGSFTVELPNGWRAIPDPEAHQVVFKQGALSVMVMVWAQDKTDPVTVANYLAGTEAALRAQCPTSQTRRQNTTLLLGAPAQYLLSTCDDPRSPAVADTAAVMTAGGNLVSILGIAPVASYFQSLPVFDAIRDSLRLAADASAGINPPGAGGEGKSARRFDLERACTVGALSATECTRRSAMELGAEAQTDGSSAAATPAGAIYRDPQGRFALTIPDGWSATAEGAQGVAGVQLRLNASFINVMPASGVTTAREVVLQKEARIAQQSHVDRQPPFGAAGIVLLDGNGVEIALDNFNGVNPQGVAVTSVVAGVSELSLEPHQFLRIESSAPTAQAEELVSLVYKVGQSVKFAPSR